MSRDTYTGTNVGAMGPNSSASNTIFDQKRMGAAADELDLKALAVELSKLRPEMRKRATEPEHDEAIAAVGRAEAAAAKGNVSETIGFLRRAGDWASRVASELGAKIAVKLIENKLDV